MEWRIVLFLVVFSCQTVAAEVSLDSCRAMALRNNKQLLAGTMRVKGAKYQKKVARAAYLPALDFTGGYAYNQKSVSVFDSDQLLPVKTFNPVTGSYEFTVAKNPTTGEPIKGADGQYVPQQVALIPKEAMTYDVHNVFFGALTLTQPVYLGGKIKALNRIAVYAGELEEARLQGDAVDVVYAVDVAYWQIVSLKAKERLAESYVTLLDTLSRNVAAMIAEGVATPSDSLMVKVKLNEAQVDLNKVKNGLSLSRMSLAQLCGLPIDTEMRLTDENRSDVLTELPIVPSSEDMTQVYLRRQDMRQLEIGSHIAHEQSRTKLSDMLPNVSLIGAYSFSNPNMFNGFSRRFDGNFSVGVLVSIPLWHWGGNYYKYKNALTQETIMKLNVADAKDKIALQVRQATYKMQEAIKTYRATQENLSSAEENLRHAQIGYKEGVMTIDNVMEAQTAWLKANSQHVDAQIDLHLCNTYLQKSLGTLPPR